MAGYTQADIPRIQANLQRMDLSDPATGAYLDDFKAGKVSNLPSGAKDLGAPAAPEPNAGYQALLDKQKQIADDYRKKLPQYSQALGNQYEAGARQNLASGLRQTDQDFNRRGLLYSSARVGQQAGQQAQSASDIASGKQQINQGLLDKANAMDAGVFTTSAGMAGADTQAYNFQAQSDIMNLKNQLLDEQRNGQAMGSLAGGIGALGGLALGSLNFNSQPVGQGTANGVLAGYYSGMGK